MIEWIEMRFAGDPSRIQLVSCSFDEGPESAAPGSFPADMAGVTLAEVLAWREAEATPVEPAVKKPEPARTWPVTFTSIPFDAEVFVDGKAMGRTPLMKLEVAEGSRKVRIVSGGETITKTIRVGRRSPTRYVWKVSEGAWESGF